jgi:site-specific DNA-cytosine methylase
MGERMGIQSMLAAQGFPPDMLDDCPLTNQGKRKVIGNGVPMPMGRAIARAVKEAVT